MVAWWIPMAASAVGSLLSSRGGGGGEQAGQQIQIPQFAPLTPAPLTARPPEQNEIKQGSLLDKLRMASTRRPMEVDPLKGMLSRQVKPGIPPVSLPPTMGLEALGRGRKGWWK